MAQLTYTAICSLDGYVADEAGRFDWSMPDEAVHAFVNELERPVGTHLYGRRLYEVLVAWEAPEMAAGQPAVIQDYARIWRGAQKIVYSRTLERVRSERTRIEREFAPDAVRALKAVAGAPLAIGGAELAGQALAAGLVDELQLLVSPVVVGGGTLALPAGQHFGLELRDQRAFANGVVFLRYRVGS